METPAAIYRSSARPYPERPAPLEYPAHFEVRQVSQDATLRWRNRKVFVSSLLKRKLVGLEQIGDSAWAVYFGAVRLGWLHETDYRIMDVLDEVKRRR